MQEDDWLRVDRYAIRSPCGSFTVACVRLNGLLTYELWQAPVVPKAMWIRIDSFATADAARAHAIPVPTGAVL